MMTIDDSYERADANTSAGALLPIPVPVRVKSNESRFIVLTKFFSWLTACLLASAVIISLVSITSERNDLRTQLTTQSHELYCRFEANVDVNFASAKQQIALVDHSVLIGKLVQAVVSGDNEGIQDLADQLDKAGIALDDTGNALIIAVDAQQAALKDCNKG